MLNINGEDWRCVLVSPTHPALLRSDGQYTLGACDDNTKKIYIRYDLTDFYFQKVLSHELTHAAMFSYNIDLAWEQEEILADLIATYGKEIIHMTNIVFKRIKEIRGT